MSEVDIRLLLLDQYEQALNRAWQKGDVDAALGAAQALLKVRQDALGADHAEVANALYEIAEALRQKRELTGARDVLRQALVIEEKQYGKDHERYGEALQRLGDVLLALREVDEAATVLSDASRVLQATLGAGDTRVAMALGAEAAVLRLRGEFPTQLLYRAAEIFERTQSPLLRQALQDLAEVALDSHELDIAEDAATRAVRLHTSPSAQRAHALETLGEVLERRGRNVEAREQYRAALEMYEQSLAPHHPQVGVASMNLATLELRLGEVERATQLAEHALRVFVDAFGPRHTHTRAMGEALKRTFADHEKAWEALAHIIQIPA